MAVKQTIKMVDISELKTDHESTMIDSPQV